MTNRKVHTTTASVENKTPVINLEEEQRPYKVYEFTSIAKTHHIYLSEAVGDPEEYVDLIHRIKTAQPNDLIYLYLNTPGGQIRTGVQIINAMRACPARIITVLESEAHSLGTVLFLTGDEFVVHENTRMMFHNYSGGLFGKGNEQVAELASTVSWFNKLAHDIYVPFLSEEEVAAMLNGHDIWMEAEEIRERLGQMVEQMEEDAKAKLPEEAAALREEAQRLINEADEMDPPKPTPKKRAPKKRAAAPKPTPESEPAE